MSRRAPEYLLDLVERQLYRDGEALSLTPKAFALLQLLVEQRGRSLDKTEILAKLWQGTTVSDACIKDYIKDLRQALGDDAAAPRHIATRRGLGYRYIGDIAIRDASSAGAAAFVAEPVVLVLPFDAAEADTYLADGVSAEVCAGLGRFRQLVVISALSSFQCRGAPAVEAARRFQARWVVSGGLQRRDGQLNIDAQLIDATTGAVSWADRHLAEPEQLIAIEQGLVSRIVTTLVAQLEQAHTRAALVKPAAERTAHERVLFARHRLSRMTEADILAARAALLQTLEYYPSSAEAHTWLAETYYCEAQAAWCADARVAAQRALEYGQRAVELDGLDSLAHLNVAWGNLMLRESTELAAAQARRALELNPNDYYTLCFISALRLCSGDVGGAISSGQAALARSPLTPAACSFTLGFAHYLDHAYLEALDAFGRIHRPRPEVHAGVAACYAALGRHAEAEAAARSFCATPSAQALRGGGAGAWRSHFKRSLPLYDVRRLEQLLDGLERAGLPESV